MAIVIPRPQLSLAEKLYFVEIFKGLALTIGHAFRTLTKVDTLETLDYPEVQPDLPQDYRARHRLMQRPDGSPRCVACFMCSTACPARCIEIVAEESDNPHVEKRPEVFNIDLLLCIYCGMCVEACPCDAIRMDTKQAILVEDAREKFIITKDSMLDWKPQDYPDNDEISQQAPGGLKHAAALAAFQSGDHS